MRTGFSSAQLEDPALKAAEAELRACVHCGMCNSACPTYAVLGDERDGPRGRIQLIQAMLETGGKPAPEAVTHIDRCLSCLACRTTCPSSVDYARLVDTGRAHIAKHHRRPLGQRAFRFLLKTILPRPALFRAGLRLAPLGRALSGFLPAKLRRLAAMAPASMPAAPVRAGTHASRGTRVKRVALMPGCVSRVLAPETDAAIIHVLNGLGVEVMIPPGTGCCGAIAHHLGHEDEARSLARAHVRAWTKRGPFDAVIASATGCAAFARDFTHLLNGGAQPPPVRDPLDLMAELGWHGRAPEPLKIAVHTPCSLVHGLKTPGHAERLLAGAGFEIVRTRDALACCGSAGTYSLLQPEIAAELRTRKIEGLETNRPDAIVSANIGCLEHMRAGTAIPVLHPAELLDWASGGPKPRALR
jgi:glycolate oxidase iron-sulfur subunit